MILERRNRQRTVVFVKAWFKISSVIGLSQQLRNEVLLRRRDNEIHPFHGFQLAIHQASGQHNFGGRMVFSNPPDRFKRLAVGACGAGLVINLYGLYTGNISTFLFGLVLAGATLALLFTAEVLTWFGVQLTGGDPYRGRPA